MYNIDWYNKNVAKKAQTRIRCTFPSICLHKEGYLYTNLTIALNTHKMYLVHRLVADTFCTKPKSDEELYVNHLNGDKHDNRASNLEWVTMAENNQHFVDYLCTPEQSGKKQVYQYDVLGNLVGVYGCLSDLQDKYSVGRISQVCTHEYLQKLYMGYYWSYIPVEDVPSAIRENLRTIFQRHYQVLKSGLIYSSFYRKGVRIKLGPYSSMQEAQDSLINTWLVYYVLDNPTDNYMKKE